MREIKGIGIGRRWRRIGIKVYTAMILSRADCVNWITCSRWAFQSINKFTMNKLDLAVFLDVPGRGKSLERIFSPRLSASDFSSAYFMVFKTNPEVNMGEGVG